MKTNLPAGYMAIFVKCKAINPLEDGEKRSPYGYLYIVSTEIRKRKRILSSYYACQFKLNFLTYYIN